MEVRGRETIEHSGKGRPVMLAEVSARLWDSGGPENDEEGTTSPHPNPPPVQISATGVSVNTPSSHHFTPILLLDPSGMHYNTLVFTFMTIRSLPPYV